MRAPPGKTLSQNDGPSAARSLITLPPAFHLGVKEMGERGTGGRVCYSGGADREKGVCSGTLCTGHLILGGGSQALLMNPTPPAELVRFKSRHLVDKPESLLESEPSSNLTGLRGFQ